MRIIRQMLSTLIFHLLAVLFLAGAADTQDELPTNTELLDRVLGKSIERFADELPPGSSLIISIEGTEYDWFFRHRVIETLTENGFTVHGANSRLTEGFYSVELVVERFGVQYSDVHRRSFLGSRRMKRRADGEFSIRITGASGERVVKVAETISDEVPFAKRNDIENNALPFTRAEVPDGSLIERFLGPAVIIAATGMVIYLFFSVRS